MFTRDFRNDPATFLDYTFGSGGVGGRFGGAYLDGRVSLQGWTATNELTQVSIKCSTYRKAVRRLRQHLAGY